MSKKSSPAKGGGQPRGKGDQKKETHNIKLGREGLLAQDVQVLVEGLDALLGVDGGDGGDDDGLETLVVDHLVVVVVQLDAVGLELGLAPLELLGVGGEDGDELGAGGPVEEVGGMTLAHAAEASDAHLESLCCYGHFGSMCARV